MCRRVKLTILLFFVSVGLAGAFQVPETGITECYDADGNLIFPCPGPSEAFYGQDGNIVRNNMDYTDNGTTITDNVTVRVWQKTDDGETRTWAQAVAFCGSSMRLPTLIELDSIMDLSVEAGPAINPIFAGTAAAGYWTSTVDPDNVDNVWVLDFGTTEDSIVAKTTTNYTRCVEVTQ
jgi:hypothetical protein